MGQIEKIKRRKIHTFCTNKSRIETHSAMPCLFNRRSTAGRLSLCKDYKISGRLLFEWWTFPSFTQERCTGKNPQTKNLKLEFDDTFKTNYTSSQEANDLLPLLERTVDPHSVQLYTKSRDASDHIAGYVAFKAVKYCKDCCYNSLESFDSAPAHSDSYVNLLSRDGLKHPSKQ